MNLKRAHEIVPAILHLGRFKKMIKVRIWAQAPEQEDQIIKNVKLHS
jgi:hypothetical protein